MTKRRRRSDGPGRAPLFSPGRPVAAGRDEQRWFWAAIAAGMASEDAAVEAGMSQAVGTRLFRKAGAAVLTEQPLNQSAAWFMVRRRAAAAGIAAAIGNHTFRATGITNFLENGGTLEHAQDMAAHASPRTTRLYDRRKEKITQAQVERIRL
jgi:site-specific recombinase XerD